MKKLNLSLLLVSSLFIFSLTACGNEQKSDSQMHSMHQEEKQTEVAPNVVFENDYAKVVKVTLAPGAQLKAHQAKERVIYSLSDYTIDWIEQGENKGVKSWKKGDVHAHQAAEHAAKNNGNSTAEWVAFINKGAELPDCSESTLAKDVMRIAPALAQLLFENDAFQITEVTLPKGAKLPMHAGANRIIYSLSDYHIIYESKKEGKGEKSFKTGDVHWHNGCQHALENIGDTEAKFLVVSYKPQP